MLSCHKKNVSWIFSARCNLQPGLFHAFLSHNPDCSTLVSSQLRLFLAVQLTTQTDPRCLAHNSDCSTRFSSPKTVSRFVSHHPRLFHALLPTTQGFSGFVCNPQSRLFSHCSPQPRLLKALQPTTSLLNALQPTTQTVQRFETLNADCFTYILNRPVQQCSKTMTVFGIVTYMYVCMYITVHTTFRNKSTKLQINPKFLSMSRLLM